MKSFQVIVLAFVGAVMAQGRICSQSSECGENECCVIVANFGAVCQDLAQLSYSCSPYAFGQKILPTDVFGGHCPCQVGNSCKDGTCVAGKVDDLA